jgi:hypothetical protein
LDEKTTLHKILQVGYLVQMVNILTLIKIGITPIQVLENFHILIFFELKHGDGPSWKGDAQLGKVHRNPRYRAKLHPKTSYSPKCVIYIADSHLWQWL